MENTFTIIGCKYSSISKYFMHCFKHRSEKILQLDLKNNYILDFTSKATEMKILLYIHIVSSEKLKGKTFFSTSKINILYLTPKIKYKFM